MMGVSLVALLLLLVMRQLVVVLLLLVLHGIRAVACATSVAPSTSGHVVVDGRLGAVGWCV